MNEEGGDGYLDLVGCYAYDRKKHVERRIGRGEGLVGQCVLEKSAIYMTNLPANYLKSRPSQALIRSVESQR